MATSPAQAPPPLVLLQFAGNRRNKPALRDKRPGIRFAKHPLLRPIERVFVLSTEGDRDSKEHAESLAEALGHNTRGGLKVSLQPLSAGAPPEPTSRAHVDDGINAFVASLAEEQFGRRFLDVEFVVWADVGAPEQWTSLIDALDARGARVSVAWDQGNDNLSVWRCPPEARGIEPDVTRLERAPAAWNVLLTGPTGAGKSEMARRLHKAWSKGGQPRRGEFVSLNTAALSRELLQSELFGHVKGAFTGASSEHKGAFQRAHEGTLFLDEIGDLPLDLQSKLLTVLDIDSGTRRRSFTPIGSTRASQVDVRLVFGTNQDLAAMAQQRSFRLDLLGRISTHHLKLPALSVARHRIFSAYIRHLEALRALYASADRHALRFSFSLEARRRLLSFVFSDESAWVWNHRDVMQSAERLALRAWVDTAASSHEVTITLSHLDAELAELTSRWCALGAGREESEDGWAAVRARTSEASWEKLSMVERWELRYLIEARAATENNADAWRWIVKHKLLEGATADKITQKNPSNAFLKRWQRYASRLQDSRP